MASTIVWFRQDLRLADNPALSAAVGLDQPIIPVFVWPTASRSRWMPGAASNWWLDKSLNELAKELAKMDSRLIVRRGNPREVIPDLAAEIGAGTILWNRRYEPDAIHDDAKIKTILRGKAFDAQSFNSNLLHEPWEIKTRKDEPYKVFTPYWRAAMAAVEPARPMPAPSRLPPPPRWPRSDSIKSLELEPRIDWAGKIRASWQPGAGGAEAELSRFIEEGISRYEDQRNRPDFTGTSRLSPHLHFGEISPRHIWHAVKNALGSKRGGPAKSAVHAFLSQLGWREFAHQLLYYFPHTTTKPLRPEFEHFPWRRNQRVLRAWQRGRTGYPIVDAGMRELWATGWMHNRVRMIVASFLVKDLLQPWQEGARWFWDTLVDADLANNTLGWQWTAGCGADAAPYFRIFNPVTQGQRFDPEGDYVRQWVHELKDVPKTWIHCPWEAPPIELERAGVRLGQSYPEPMVDHSKARKAALEAFSVLRQKG